ncbi:Jouberin [Physocladia obscura]|uniref:Jouberin n=1 Tax=Physocladia obscura TaxID=109957 RepID=A0AAD5XA55_9FUNG|nr:Jouberin [Physocladia obscura]
MSKEPDPNLISVTQTTNIFKHVGKDASDFEGLATNIKIWKTDPLVADAMVLHPIVRIHIIDDSQSGRPLKKTSPNPHIPIASTPFTKNRETVDFILPVMTKPFSLQKHKTTAAAWSENILFVQDYLSLFARDVNCVVFFEILDFGCKNGWRRVAWAFVKLIAGHGQTNTEIPLRLQLFRFPQDHFGVDDFARQAVQRITGRLNNDGALGVGNNVSDGVPFVYQCWATGKRVLYPSTIYVEIFAKQCPEPHLVTRRPKNATEIETGKLTYNELMDEYLAKRNHISERPVEISEKRCIRMSIFVERSVPRSVQPHYDDKIPRHKHLQWTDRVLASASSDNTIQLFTRRVASSPTKTTDSFTPLAIFHHPSYCYSVAFHPNFSANKMVASGCEDGVVRIWAADGDENGANGDKGHQRRPVVWNCLKPESSIRAISITPTTNRKLAILLPAKNIIYALDTRIHRLTTKYATAQNCPTQLSPASRVVTFSPCGTHLYAHADDSRVFIWKAETGALVHVYRAGGGGIAVHPLDDYVAICRSTGVDVYTWDGTRDEDLGQGMRGSETVRRESEGASFVVKSNETVEEEKEDRGGGKRINEEVDPDVKALRRVADEVLQKLGIFGGVGHGMENSIERRGQIRIGAFTGDGKLSAID